MKQPCVYILASDRYGTLYVGVTSDLIARLCQHRTATGSRFTSQHHAFRLMRYELFADRPTAIAREKQLKRWHRAWKIGLIEQENPDWHDLAPGLGVAPVPPSSRRDGP